MKKRMLVYALIRDIIMNRNLQCCVVFASLEVHIRSNRNKVGQEGESFSKEFFRHMA